MKTNNEIASQPKKINPTSYGISINQKIIAVDVQNHYDDDEYAGDHIKN